MPLPEPKYQNSAGRLLAALSAIQTGKTYLDALPALFEPAAKTEREKQRAGIAALQELDQLYLEFLSEMRGPSLSDETREVLLAGLHQLPETIYPIQLNAQFRAPTEPEKSLITMAATLLPREGSLEQDDLDKIRESIAELRKLVENGDLPPSIRNMLLELIRLAEDAIARYNIRGSRGLKKAFNTMLGEVAAAYASGEDAKDPGVWEKTASFLATFATITTSVAKCAPLLAKGTSWLLEFVHKHPDH